MIIIIQSHHPNQAVFFVPIKIIQRKKNLRANLPNLQSSKSILNLIVFCLLNVNDLPTPKSCTTFFRLNSSISLDLIEQQLPLMIGVYTN